MAGIRNIGLSEAVREYATYRSRRGKSVNTVTSEQRILSRFARELEGRRGLLTKNVTPGKVSDWMDSQEIAESSFNNYRAKLRGFHAWCVKKGYVRLGCDWFEDVQDKTVPAQMYYRPSPTEMLTMLENTEDPRDRVYLSAAMNTACRESELIPLRVGDVDLDKGKIRIYVAKTKKHVEKPISLEFDAELRAWFVFYAQMIGRPLEDDDHLFPLRVINDETRERDKNGRFLKTAITSESWIYYPDCHLVKANRVVHLALQSIGKDHKKAGTHTLRRGVALATQVHQESLGKTYGDALRVTAQLLSHKSTAQTEVYIGRTSAQAQLDDLITGQSFLGAMTDRSNVTPIRRKSVEGS